jgi:hypothetical protein
MKRLYAILILWFIGASCAFAETPVSICMTTNGSNCVPISPTFPLPVTVNGSSFVNITTNTDTNVKASAGTVIGILVNTAGLTSNVKIYNDADGTCSSSLVGTFSTLAQIALTNLAINMSTGICVKTAGGTPADITILYR